MLGGLTDAISTMLRAGLHIDKGLPLEGSYSQFHYARQKDTPLEIEIIMLPANRRTPGGAGELGVPRPRSARRERVRPCDRHASRAASRSSSPSTSNRSHAEEPPPCPTYTFTVNGEHRHRRRAGRPGAAVGAARQARRHRPEVRLRHRRLPGLHQPPRRRGVPPVRHAGRRVRRPPGHHHRGAGRRRRAASRSRRPGSTRTSRSAASASPARSWRRSRCSGRTRTRPTRTSTRSTNVCRCGTYFRIRQAIKQAAATMRA